MLFCASVVLIVKAWSCNAALFSDELERILTIPVYWRQPFNPWWNICIFRTNSNTTHEDASIKVQEFSAGHLYKWLEQFSFTFDCI